MSEPQRDMRYRRMHILFPDAERWFFRKFRQFCNGADERTDQSAFRKMEKFKLHRIFSGRHKYICTSRKTVCTFQWSSCLSGHKRTDRRHQSRLPAGWRNEDAWWTFRTNISYSRTRSADHTWQNSRTYKPRTYVRYFPWVIWKTKKHGDTNLYPHDKRPSGGDKGNDAWNSRKSKRPSSGLHKDTYASHYPRH